MDKLPTEILCQILSQLDRPHAPLASVNQRWRDIMERKLWSKIRITMEELEVFRRSFHANTLRRQNLSHIDITLRGYFQNTVNEVSHGQGDSSSDEDEELKDAECGLKGSEQDEVICKEDGKFNAEPKDDEDCENLDVCLGGEMSSDADNKDFDEQDEDNNSDGNDENNGENEEDSSDEGTDEGTDEEEEESSNDEEDNKANWKNSQKRMSVFRDEHSRFFREIKSIWIVLSSWGKDLKVTDIEIHIRGKPIYECLGPFFRKPTLVDACLPPDMWLYARNLAGMPTLSSVTKLKFGICSEIDIWPAIVACQIAHTLPNVLDLIISCHDGVNILKYARKRFRDLLAGELLNLPTSLQNVGLSLEFASNMNEKFNPPHFLTNGIDTLSQAVGYLSTQLTSLEITLNQISPDLFWDPKVPFLASARPVLWPSLSKFSIVTGIETSAGKYSMRGADRSLPYPPIQDSDNWGSEDRAFHALGEDDRICGFRIRPKPEYFNNLAISIARATACMPKLAALSVEILSEYCEDYGYDEYHGWGFYFQSGNNAKYGWYSPWEYDNTKADSIDLEYARTEWVFECPNLQVQWEEPEEAKTLWQEKFANVNFDVVTMEYDEDTRRRVWERRRDGVLLEVIPRESE